MQLESLNNSKKDTNASEISIDNDRVIKEQNTKITELENKIKNIINDKNNDEDK